MDNTIQTEKFVYLALSFLLILGTVFFPLNSVWITWKTFTKLNEQVDVVNQVNNIDDKLLQKVNTIRESKTIINEDQFDPESINIGKTNPFTE
jgi:hypothetical protein